MDLIFDIACLHTIWLVVWLPFLAFSHILGMIIPIDFHIFQRGSNHQPAIVLLPLCWKLEAMYSIARIVDAFRVVKLMVQHISLLDFNLGRAGSLEPGTNAVGLQVQLHSLLQHAVQLVMPHWVLSVLNVHEMESNVCIVHYWYVLSLRCSIALWPAEVAFSNSGSSNILQFPDGIELQSASLKFGIG